LSNNWGSLFGRVKFTKKRGNTFAIVTGEKSSHPEYIAVKKIKLPQAIRQTRVMTCGGEGGQFDFVYVNTNKRLATL